MKKTTTIKINTKTGEQTTTVKETPQSDYLARLAGGSWIR